MTGEENTDELAVIKRSLNAWMRSMRGTQVEWAIKLARVKEQCKAHHVPFKHWCKKRNSFQTDLFMKMTDIAIEANGDRERIGKELAKLQDDFEAFKQEDFAYIWAAAPYVFRNE